MPVNVPITSITSGFGLRQHPVSGKPNVKHNGIDYRVAVGTPVFATASGRVLKADFQYQDPTKGLGLRVILGHKNDNSTNYCHLSRVTVKEGQYVKAGDVIGYSGNTGSSTGPHLHYEERHSGTPHEPTFEPDRYGAGGQRI
jgi:murein DD-endopeptidase MepM/ murein hydrolase activator NlpD